MTVILKFLPLIMICYC